MFGSLIIGALAGALTRWAEGRVKPVIEAMEVEGTDLDDREILVLTFVLAMLAGAIVLWLFGMNGTTFWMVFGSVLGFFWERIRDIFKALMAIRNGDDVAEALELGDLDAPVAAQEKEEKPAPKAAPKAAAKPAAKAAAKPAAKTTSKAAKKPAAKARTKTTAAKK